MAIQIETERLILKEMAETDAENLFKLNADPIVTRYTGEGAFGNISEALDFIKSYQNIYNTYYCGRLSTFIKETGEYIGWCGLKYLVDKNQTDLGYRFMQPYWGKGYATEAAKACLDDGFKRLNLNKIFATAMTENAASINIFKKLGLKYIKNNDCGSQPGVVYAITKQEWK